MRWTCRVGSCGDCWCWYLPARDADGVAMLSEASVAGALCWVFWWRRAPGADPTVAAGEVVEVVAAGWSRM